MTVYVSPESKVEGYLEEDAMVLGHSIIGSGTLIGKGVIVGHPIEQKIREFTSFRRPDIGRYYATSQGAAIGKDCIVRSGTVVYEMAQLGDRVRTGHNALIREQCVIGDDTLIGSSAMLDGMVKVGRRVSIQSNAYLPNLTVVEDDVFIAPNVCFTNDRYPQTRRLIGVVVERNAIICANATLIAGVKVGENAVVGAGAVVTKDVPHDTVVVGNPACIHMTRKEYNEKREKWEKSGGQSKMTSV